MKIWQMQAIILFITALVETPLIACYVMTIHDRR